MCTVEEVFVLYRKQRKTCDFQGLALALRTSYRRLIAWELFLKDPVYKVVQINYYLLQGLLCKPVCKFGRCEVKAEKYFQTRKGELINTNLSKFLSCRQFEDRGT